MNISPQRLSEAHPQVWLMLVHGERITELAKRLVQGARKLKECFLDGVSAPPHLWSVKQARVVVERRGMQEHVSIEQRTFWPVVNGVAMIPPRRAPC